MENLLYDLIELVYSHPSLKKRYFPNKFPSLKTILGENIFNIVKIILKECVIKITAHFYEMNPTNLRVASFLENYKPNSDLRDAITGALICNKKPTKKHETNTQLCFNTEEKKYYKNLTQKEYIKQSKNKYTRDRDLNFDPSEEGLMIFSNYSTTFVKSLFYAYEYIKYSVNFALKLNELFALKNLTPGLEKLLLISTDDVYLYFKGLENLEVAFKQKRSLVKKCQHYSFEKIEGITSIKLPQEIQPLGLLDFSKIRIKLYLAYKRVTD